VGAVFRDSEWLVGHSKNGPMNQTYRSWLPILVHNSSPSAAAGLTKVRRCRLQTGPRSLARPDAPKIGYMSTVADIWAIAGLIELNPLV
jgi:hypothetical protein